MYLASEAEIKSIMGQELDRREAMAGTLGLSILRDGPTTATPALCEHNSPKILQIGLLNALLRLRVPATIDVVQTSGFWKEGLGSQKYKRASANKSNVIWPSSIRSADGAIWIPVNQSENCRTFGEIADGQYHPLSDRFSTLSDAQRVYPFATSLKQSIDWASAQTLAYFSVGAEGGFSPGVRVITDPIRVPARVRLVGCSTAPDQLSFRAEAHSGGFARGRGVFESYDFWNYSQPDYWHWSALSCMTIDAAHVADFGVAVWCMGEHSLLEDVWCQHAQVANIFVGGYGAVGTLRNCSVWGGKQYGILLSRHPSSDFPLTGVIAKNGSGGSYRVNNLSGDGNPIHVYADGSQIIELDGLKSEQSPTVICIDGDGRGPGRQRWAISGFRAEGGEVGSAFLSIRGSATPSIQIGPGATYNYKTLIDDSSVAGRGHRVLAEQAGITALTYSLDDGDATSFATRRISFFGAPPSRHIALPPSLKSNATQEERDSLINAIRHLLTSYGLG